MDIFTDAAFVVGTQSNLRYVESLKPNQLDMSVIEEEKPQAQFVLCQLWNRIIIKLQRIKEATIPFIRDCLFLLLFLFFVSPVQVLLYLQCLSVICP